MTRKQIVVFVSTLLALSWTAQVLVLRRFGSVEAPGAAPFIVGIMFFPGLLGLAWTLASRPVRRSVQWRPAGVAAIVVSMVLPAALALSAIALLALAGLGSSDYFEITGGSVSIASGPWILGTGLQSWPRFVANILVTTVIYSALTGLATIGEEYGWRGVLQNAMIRELGFVKGVALLGGIWGIWHVPIILSGYNYPDTPVLGAFVFMPSLLIAASFVMAWLTVWNRSFWPAVLMHGAINSVYDGLMTNVTLTRPNPYTMTFLEIGLFAVLGIAAWRLARRHAATPQSSRPK